MICSDVFNILQAQIYNKAKAALCICFQYCFANNNTVPAPRLKQCIVQSLYRCIEHIQLAKTLIMLIWIFNAFFIARLLHSVLLLLCSNFVPANSHLKANLMLLFCWLTKILFHSWSARVVNSLNVISCKKSPDGMLTFYYSKRTQTQQICNPSYRISYTNPPKTRNNPEQLSTTRNNSPQLFPNGLYSA